MIGTCRICGEVREVRKAFSNVCNPCEPRRLEQARAKRALKKAHLTEDPAETEERKRTALERQMRRQKQVYQ